MKIGIEFTSEMLDSGSHDFPQGHFGDQGEIYRHANGRRRDILRSYAQDGEEEQDPSPPVAPTCGTVTRTVGNGPRLVPTGRCFGFRSVS